jgi:hypothetical protein
MNPFEGIAFPTKFANARNFVYRKVSSAKPTPSALLRVPPPDARLTLSPYEYFIISIIPAYRVNEKTRK